MFQEPFEHLTSLLDLERERPLRQAGRRRRAEQMGAFDGPIRLGQRTELRVDHSLE